MGGGQKHEQMAKVLELSDDEKAGSKVTVQMNGGGGGGMPGKIIDNRYVIPSIQTHVAIAPEEKHRTHTHTEPNSLTCFQDFSDHILVLPNKAVANGRGITSE